MHNLTISSTDVKTLPVMEQFYTIQGEGRYTGYAAYFIRLAGCDVGCVWCDVKESWNVDGFPHFKIDQLVENAASSGTEIVVITGGEPAMHNLDALTSKLRAAGLRTHIETSGAYPLTGDWHWICLSPKKFKAPLPKVLKLADELKVVVFHKSDFEWAENHASMVDESCSLYLQPEWSKCEKMLPLIIDYVKSRPRWRISLQTHKYMHIP